MLKLDNLGNLEIKQKMTKLLTRDKERVRS